MEDLSEALQYAVWRALSADPAVTAIVGDRIHDGRPEGYPCITFGPGDFVPDDAECILGRIETVQLDCWASDSKGRLRPARALAAAVKRALHKVDLDLGDHALVQLLVTSVRILQDPDGLTGHGIVTIEATAEEG